MTDAPTLTQHSSPTEAPAVEAPKRRPCGKPGRSGPPGNRNAAKNGLRMPLGKLPKGCGYLVRLLCDFRRAVEGAVMAKHGEISAYHAALINSALMHEQRSRLIQRWLARDGADATRTTTTKKATQTEGSVTTVAETKRQTGLSVMESVSMLEAQGRAADARDKVLRALGLDRHDTRTLDVAAFYAAPLPDDAQEPPPDADAGERTSVAQD